MVNIISNIELSQIPNPIVTGFAGMKLLGLHYMNNKACIKRGIKLLV